MKDMIRADWVFATLGAALVVGAVVSTLRKNARLAKFGRTVGTVVGYRVRQTVRDGRRRTFHHPLVRFEVNGHAFVHESPVSTSRPRREVGATVPMLFDPAAPSEACIDEVLEKHFVALLLSAIGAVFVGVGAWLSTLP